MAISTKNYKNVYGISFGGQHQRIANCMMLYNRPQYRTIFTPELIELGYGLRDGEVYGGSAAYLAAQGYVDDPEWEELTASNIINSSGYSAISGDKKYYLTDNITISFTDMVEDVEFTGIIDGCGYTINVTATRSGTPSSNHAWGTLIGTLSGTIKNLKINTAFNWNCSYNGNTTHQSVGGVAGRLGNGSNTTALIENCYITTQPVSDNTFHMNYTGRPAGGDHVYKSVGGIAGRIGWNISGNGSIETPTVNIINTTVNISSRWWWNNSHGGSGINRPDCGVCVGGFIGCQYAGTLNITNCSLTGTQDLYSYQQKGGDGGKTDLYKGGVIGKIGQNQSGGSNPPITHFSNFKYSWSGNAQANDGGHGNEHYTALVGHVYYTSANDNFTIANVYYTASSYAAIHGYLTWSAGQGIDSSSSYKVETVTSGPMYDETLENYIGFKRALNQTDYLWLGDISKIAQRYLNTDNSGTGQDARGQFLYKINFETKSDGTTSSDLLGQSKFEKMALQNRYIALIIPSDISNTLKITSIEYAKWAYLTNIQGTNAGTFRLYYDNGSYLDYTPPANFFNGRVSSNGGRINIYEVNHYETIDNQVYLITRNTNTGYYPVNINNEE